MLEEYKQPKKSIKAKNGQMDKKRQKVEIKRGEKRERKGEEVIQLICSTYRWVNTHMLVNKLILST